MGARLRRVLLGSVLAFASLPSHAAFHLWIIDEVFSNADGTVQYIELRALSGSQQFLTGQSITAGAGPSPRAYQFPNDLPGDTTGKTMLIGTTSFAALGLVTPDYVVPDNFLDVPSGPVNFAGVDTWNYGPMPTDGANSLYRNGSTGPRSPTNFAGQTIAPPNPPNPPRLVNISTRMQVLTGNDVMIGGFVIGAGGNKTVAIVATGPSLAPFGIANPLANPTLTLVRSSDQAVLATNDDWQSAGNAGQLSAAGFAPSNALEAAILVNLPPGAYTAIVQGAGNGTGVAVVAVYEVDSVTVPLINISTRGQVLTGNDVMIGGFVITGTGPQTVAIVATGPSLAPFGIANPLANPTLTLVRSSDQAVLATNDDWQSAANAAQLQAAGFAPGNSLEAAILMTLQPGAYTAIVQGVGGGTGVGVIGVYRAQ
jgi:hypothetical protein